MKFPQSVKGETQNLIGDAEIVTRGKQAPDDSILRPPPGSNACNQFHFKLIIKYYQCPIRTECLIIPAFARVFCG